MGGGYSIWNNGGSIYNSLHTTNPPYLLKIKWHLNPHITHENMCLKRKEKQFHYEIKVSTNNNKARPPMHPIRILRFWYFRTQPSERYYATTYKNKGLWATQPLDKILVAEILVCELGVVGNRWLSSLLLMLVLVLSLNNKYIVSLIIKPYIRIIT